MKTKKQIKMVGGILSILVLIAVGALADWITPRTASQMPANMVFDYPDTWGTNISLDGGDNYDLQITKGMSRLLWRILDQSDPAKLALAQRPILVQSSPSLMRPMNATMTSTGVVVVSLLGESLWSGLVDAVTVAHFGSSSAGMTEIMEYKVEILERLIPEADAGQEGYFLTQHHVGRDVLEKVKADAERVREVVQIRRNLTPSQRAQYQDRIEMMLKKLSAPSAEEVDSLLNDVHRSLAIEVNQSPKVSRLGA